MKWEEHENHPESSAPEKEEAAFSPEIPRAQGKSDGQAAPEESEEFPLKRELFNWGEALVEALVIIVLLFTLVVRIIGVDGSSMVPTLHDGDQLLVSHLFYDTPAQGDIVVLTKKTFNEQPIVKRIIAVEGQTVNINFDTHEVTVDGEVLYEPYINEATARPGDMTFPQTVPEGCVFVLGDNRNKSSDSRVMTLGMVDTRHILGRVLFRIYPLNAVGRVE